MEKIPPFCKGTFRYYKLAKKHQKVKNLPEKEYLLYFLYDHLAKTINYFLKQSFLRKIGGICERNFWLEI